MPAAASASRSLDERELVVVAQDLAALQREHRHPVVDAVAFAAPLRAIVGDRLALRPRTGRVRESGFRPDRRRRRPRAVPSSRSSVARALARSALASMRSSSANRSRRCARSSMLATPSRSSTAATVELALRSAVSDSSAMRCFCAAARALRIRSRLRHATTRERDRGDGGEDFGERPPVRDRHPERQHAEHRADDERDARQRASAAALAPRGGGFVGGRRRRRVRGRGGFRGLAQGLEFQLVDRAGVGAPRGEFAALDDRELRAIRLRSRPTLRRPRRRARRRTRHRVRRCGRPENRRRRRSARVRLAAPPSRRDRRAAAPAARAIPPPAAL